MKRFIILCFCSLSIISLLFLSCQSNPDPYSLDLTRKEFFQKAIDAAEGRKFKLAVDFYEAFKQKHPDDEIGHLWADYEIAFLNHKMGNDKLAVELLDELLQKYEFYDKEGSDVQWPEATRILATQVREEILGEEAEQEE